MFFRYKITATATKARKSVNQTVEVTVENSSRENRPRIEIDAIPNAISQNSGFEINAQVYQLITGCTLQWASLREENYEYLDLDVVVIVIP